VAKEKEVDNLREEGPSAWEQKLSGMGMVRVTEEAELIEVSEVPFCPLCGLRHSDWYQWRNPLTCTRWEFTYFSCVHCGSDREPHKKQARQILT